MASVVLGITTTLVVAWIFVDPAVAILLLFAVFVAAGMVLENLPRPMRQSISEIQKSGKRVSAHTRLGKSSLPKRFSSGLGPGVLRTKQRWSFHSLSNGMTMMMKARACRIL
jgi:hypothetical protein